MVIDVEDATRAKIEALWRTGYSVRQIAELVGGISKSRVHQIVSELDGRPPILASTSANRVILEAEDLDGDELLDFLDVATRARGRRLRRTVE